MVADNKAFDTAQESVKPTKFEPTPTPTPMNEEIAIPSVTFENQDIHQITNANVNNLQKEDGKVDTRRNSRLTPLIFTPRADSAINTESLGSFEKLSTPNLLETKEKTN
jgi:hypothetical protein